MNSINEQIYLPLLEEYCQKGGITLSDMCGYDQGPFIPYTFCRYDKSPLKIFYIGIDTYYWVTLETLKTAYDSGNLKLYMQENASAMNREKIFNWGNQTSFWGTIARMQLKIRTGKYYNDITQLNDYERNILDEIGYGNIFSIETLKTINENRGIGLTDKTVYEKLRQLSYPLTDFSTMLKAYKPDLVFLFSWAEYDLGKLKFDEIKDEYEDKFRAVYSIPEYNSKLIWTTHPSSFSFKQTNMQDMVEYLYETVKRLNLV